MPHEIIVASTQIVLKTLDLSLDPYSAKLRVFLGGNVAFPSNMNFVNGSWCCLCLVLEFMLS